MPPAKKILLIHFYSNGDALYATAVARQIKQDFPGCQLTWAIASNCKNIIANNPYVDHVIVVDYVHCNDPAVFRNLKQKTDLKEYDEVFITHPSYLKNNALYDGCIRSNVFRAYPHPITVPVTPVLVLTDDEKHTCDEFARKQQLSQYRHVILFEFAPQSGQLNITKEKAIAIAEDLVKQESTAVILSSAHKINHANKAVIDGSPLTLRETAALTHHCTLLLGCSSGITWITTSSAAKLLPMVQILNPYTTWVNPISRDFERFGLPVEKVVELFDSEHHKIIACVSAALNDFPSARARYHQQVPLHFKTSRKIVYDLLCYFKFGAILKHINVNVEVYGWNPAFFREVLLGIVMAPFLLLSRIFTKHLLKYFPLKQDK
ncbi:MAG: hypothetical protein IPM95_03925 [Sphingobacteriales bacterium]|nr:hypothetical protein [Sphingobacteriales bacterium]